MQTRRTFISTALAGAAAIAASSTLFGEAFAQAPDQTATSSTDIEPDGVAPAHTIDWHNHWITPRVVALLQQHDLQNPSQGDQFGGGGVGGGRPNPKAPGPNSNFVIPAEARIANLDATGIERQVVSWPTTVGWDVVLSPDEARPVWTAFNEELSDIVKEHPDRFSSYGTVPTSDIPWAVHEAERALGDLGHIGITLPVGAFQSLEGAKHIEPVVDVIQRHQAILYLHTGPAYHTIPGQRFSDQAPDVSHLAAGGLSAPASFARAAVTLTQTDYLKPYPDIAVQIAMMGGLTSFLFSLTTLSPHPDDGPDPIQRLRRVYLDASTSRVPGTLELAVKTIGADRVLFGTDYGAGNRTDTIVAAVNEANITTAERSAVFVDTGQKLFAAKGRRKA